LIATPIPEAFTFPGVSFLGGTVRAQGFVIRSGEGLGEHNVCSARLVPVVQLIEVRWIAGHEVAKEEQRASD
jgi:hypothetical protein